MWNVLTEPTYVCARRIRTRTGTAIATASVYSIGTQKFKVEPQRLSDFYERKIAETPFSWWDEEQIIKFVLFFVIYNLRLLERMVGEISGAPILFWTQSRPYLQVWRTLSWNIQEVL